jgi:hypothetical protein
MAPCSKVVVAIVIVAVISFGYLTTGVAPSEVSSINPATFDSGLLAPTLDLSPPPIPSHLLCFALLPPPACDLLMVVLRSPPPSIEAPLFNASCNSRFRLRSYNPLLLVRACCNLLMVVPIWLLLNASQFCSNHLCRRPLALLLHFFFFTSQAPSRAPPPRHGSGPVGI